MNNIYMVWKEDTDMLAIEGEAVALAERRRQESEDAVRGLSVTFWGKPIRAERFSVERYDLPFTEGDVTEEIWPEDEG